MIASKTRSEIPARFWRPRLPPSRQGARWLDILKTQACYQLIDPGSEWRLHRDWQERSAMGDLLGRPAEVVGACAVSLPG